MSEIEVLHHGAVTGVTGSCHQYISPSVNLLVDCGLFQGDEAERDLADFPFDVSQVDALVVTHGHIDHVGRIPWLLAAGFDRPIYCTLPTAKLLPVILRDALEIHVPDDRALVDSVMARLQRLIVGVEFGEWVCFSPPLTPPQKGAGPTEGDTPPLTPPQGGGESTAGDGVSIRFQNAGHILGSAYVEVKAGEHVTVFSGDLGSPGAVFVESPVSPARADVLVLESTYGDKVHTQRTQREQLLAELVNKALADHGTLLIPAFSLGRTQELLAMFEHLLYTGQLNWPSDTPLPVILDSPLAADLTSAYRSLNAYWPQWLQQRKAEGRLPLAFDSLITVTDHHEHIRLVKRLAQKVQPAIVIAASGMCQGGRIVNYLQALGPLPTTDILFVGYQARGTLGAALQRRDMAALARAGICDLKAQVHTVSGFSAHADREDLLAFVAGMESGPGEVRLVHGDASAKQALQRALMSQLGLERVLVVR